MTKSAARPKAAEFSPAQTKEQDHRNVVGVRPYRIRRPSVLHTMRRTRCGSRSSATQKWLAEKKPDVILYVFNCPHHVVLPGSLLALRAGRRRGVLPGRRGRRSGALPTFKGHTKLAQHIAFSLVERRVRGLSYFQGKDSGSRLLAAVAAAACSRTGPDPGGSRSFAVSVACSTHRAQAAAAFSGRSAARCARPSRAIRKTSRWPSPAPRPVAVGHGERCINTPWDMEFLERLEKDPEGLTNVHRGVREAGW